jgi:anti-anti-sigma factor
MHSLAFVRPIGHFYGGNETAELEHKLGALLDGTRNVVIDLERTRDLNSIAIGVLLGALSQAQRHHTEIALCNADRGIENVLTILKLVNVLPVYPNLAAALAAFGRRPAEKRPAPTGSSAHQRHTDPAGAAP